MYPKKFGAIWLNFTPNSSDDKAVKFGELSGYISGIIHMLKHPEMGNERNNNSLLER
jgi:hypothetical protein